MLYTNTGEGLHRFVDPVDNEVYLYSQFETADAKRVYACFDQPDLKAVSHACTSRRPRTGRSSRTAASSRSVDRAAGRQDGALRAHAADQSRTSPRSSPGRITSSTRSPRRHRSRAVLPRVAGRVPGLRRDLHRDQAGLRLVPGAVRHAGTRSRKYDQLFVPEFNAGAMENAGCVTFLEDYVFRVARSRSRRTSGAPTRSCTRWRTCGSATS